MMYYHRHAGTFRATADPGILQELLLVRLNYVRRELLFDVLGRLLPRVPADVVDEIEMCMDPVILEDWIMVANSADSFDLFRNHVLETAPK